MKTEKNIEIFNFLIAIIGIICLFAAVWSNGWMILRLSVTGLMLIGWSIGINEKRLNQMHERVLNIGG